MLLIALLFTSFLAQAQAPDPGAFCAPNAFADELDASLRIEVVCFVKNANLKDIWQVRFSLNDGSTQLFFMKDPVYDQAASLQTNKAILKSPLYAEGGFGLLVGEIQFLYPLENNKAPRAEGYVPSGLSFQLPNVGAPGLKAPN